MSVRSTTKAHQDWKNMYLIQKKETRSGAPERLASLAQHIASIVNSWLTSVLFGDDPTVTSNIKLNNLCLKFFTTEIKNAYWNKNVMTPVEFLHESFESGFFTPLWEKLRYDLISLLDQEVPIIRPDYSISHMLRENTPKVGIFECFYRKKTIDYREL